MRDREFKIYDKNLNEVIENQDIISINFNKKFFVSTHFSDYFNNNYELVEYTGILDKNGNKIFEGDIIGNKQYISVIGFVEFRNGKYIVSNSSYNMPLSFYSSEFIEILGNISNTDDCAKYKKYLYERKLVY